MSEQQLESPTSRFVQVAAGLGLGFFCALFIVISVMEHAHVLELIGQGLMLVLRLPQTAASGAVRERATSVGATRPVRQSGPQPPPPP